MICGLSYILEKYIKYNKVGLDLRMLEFKVNPEWSGYSARLSKERELRRFSHVDQYRKISRFKNDKRGTRRFKGDKPKISATKITFA